MLNVKVKEFTALKCSPGINSAHLLHFTFIVLHLIYQLLLLRYP